MKYISYFDAQELIAMGDLSVTVTDGPRFYESVAIEFDSQYRTFVAKSYKDLAKISERYDIKLNPHKAFAFTSDERFFKSIIPAPARYQSFNGIFEGDSFCGLEI